jgi:hypothetical protein
MRRYPSGVMERIKIAKSFGYVLIRMKKHLVFQHPDGHQVVCSKSPSDNRSMKEFVSDLKRSSLLIMVSQD